MTVPHEDTLDCGDPTAWDTIPALGDRPTRQYQGTSFQARRRAARGLPDPMTLAYEYTLDPMTRDQTYDLLEGLALVNGKHEVELEGCSVVATALKNDLVEVIATVISEEGEDMFLFVEDLARRFGFAEGRVGHRKPIRGYLLDDGSVQLVD